MNHDYAHCLDYTEKCPKKCFRAQLVRDLAWYNSHGNCQTHPMIGVSLCWMHLEGTDECQIGKEK